MTDEAHHKDCIAHLGRNDFCVVVKEDKTQQKEKDPYGGNKLPPWILSLENMTKIMNEPISYAVFLP